MTMLNHKFDAVDRTQFRDGMARLGSAVSVVTTRFEGRRYGFTASAVCSVSDAPPTLLVCINLANSSFSAFADARQFCVNILLPRHEDIANVFGGKAPVGDRFEYGDWVEGLTGSPVLEDASVSFECLLTDTIDQATHRVLFGRVINLRKNAEQATLLYCRRRYLHG